MNASGAPAQQTGQSPLDSLLSRCQQLELLLQELSMAVAVQESLIDPLLQFLNQVALNLTSAMPVAHPSTVTIRDSTHESL